jgi:hypothetical protein
MFNDDSIYENFCVDDADLTFENYEELFGTSHIQTEQLFDDAGIDSYFESKEMLADECNEVCTFPYEICFIYYLFWGKELSWRESVLLVSLSTSLEVVMSSSFVKKKVHLSKFRSGPFWCHCKVFNFLIHPRLIH